MFISNRLLPGTPAGWILMLIDISIVSFILYKGILLIEGTRAVQLVKGLFVIVLFSFYSNFLGLRTINWLLGRLELVIAVALPVVFQPELRRALEQLGKGKMFARSVSVLGAEDMAHLINQVTHAVMELSEEKTGALIVVEREVGINDYIDTGVKLDAMVSSELLVNLFVENTPLHDGAVIIRGDRVIAAGCFLPLSDNPYLSSKLGTRHRASLGISEVSDAVTVVVSEETGTISLSQGGKLTRYLDEQSLKKQLENILLTNTYNGTMGFWKGRDK